MRPIEGAALVAVGIAGVLLGRAIGPTPIRSTEPGEIYEPDQLEADVSRALHEATTQARAGALVRSFEGLTSENVVGAARAYRAATGEDDPVDLQLFLGAWSRLDPEAAMAEVESWPFQSRRELGIRIVIREWAASGRALEAGGYVDSLTDPEARAVAVAPLVRGWALSGDATGARDLARKFFEREKRKDVVDALIGGVLRVEGASGVLELARDLDPSTGDAFARSVAAAAIRLAGRENPQAAAAYYDELIESGPAPWLAGSLVRIAGLLRNGDAEAALEWVLAQPDGPERVRALQETMGTWASRDLDAAWKWFEAHRAQGPGGVDAPLSTTDATLLAGLVRRMARVRPAEAATWAIRIEPPSERIEMLRRVAYFWSMSDPSAADRWIAGLGLPDAARARIEEAATWGRSGADDDSSEEPGLRGNPASSAAAPSERSLE